MFCKQGSEFRQLFRDIRIDWCQLMDSNKKQNGLVMALLKMLKDCCAHLFHKCPYNGALALTNLTTNKEFFNLAPTGLFRIWLKGNFSNGKGSKVSVFAALLITVS